MSDLPAPKFLHGGQPGGAEWAAGELRGHGDCEVAMIETKGAAYLSAQEARDLAMALLHWAGS